MVLNVEIRKKGYNCIEIGTKEENFGTVQIWYKSPKNSLIDSDIKSELSAIAVAEIIREYLQTYVDIHSKGEPK